MLHAFLEILDAFEYNNKDAIYNNNNNNNIIILMFTR